MKSSNFFCVFFIVNLISLSVSEIPHSVAQKKSALIQESQLYTQQQKDRLFQQALAIFPEDKIPAQYRVVVETFPPQRCATMLVEEIRQNMHLFSPERQAVLQELFVRPDLPLSTVTESGFRIHYTLSGADAVSDVDSDGNGLPDFVDEVAAAYEKSFRIEVEHLRYRQAPDDAGVDGPEYDVYIVDLRGGVYGFTTSDGGIPSTLRDDARSYIEMDNDFLNNQFTQGVPGAQVTAAHEYFHSIQFGYRVFKIERSNEPFYYELCSVWMEDVVFDEVNDYFQYMRPFFQRTGIPFNQFDRFFHAYGEAIWNFFLVKKFDDFDLVRRSWEIMESNDPAIDAVNQALFEEGSSLADEFAEFAIWNYFTGSRADTIQFHNESPHYPEIALNGEFVIGDTTTHQSAETSITIADSSLSLTHKYYRFTTFSADKYLLTASSSTPENWKIAVIVLGPESGHEFHVFDLGESLDIGFLPRFSEVVVIPVNVQVLDGDNLNKLTNTYSFFTFNLIRVPVESTDEQGISAIYPNPFIMGDHDRINFEFFPKDTDNLEVRIFSAAGKVVKTDKLTNGSGALTPSTFAWDGTDDDNVVLPSGIYIIQLKQGDFIESKKFAVIRR
ncbi:T9SS type A sorting domain-containing protein [candidate division KSB1 bacterium]|nr:T9SS type A sorting domain-containing protein [candidate division KSB1 bacterium]NIR72283.1 T9SS type A sorting domain-containing protein [candidate division KSB1 bacterium]NIS24254.1 T9SS type A sorting domain-containing protein [candidate division KSB1 bacterium]NIT71169.1 T9SS type A sorting domain-containing protein [candidate division KSB1 bacterium]NIU24873.1 T9SS type A sorting domain-containing protein [candidate division KSB1 bacterium]